ncbi:MAG: ATP-binding cassette domain-containing protein [Gemmataceae bacterium]|nr:ATP-binding cassette domain-containing protein [Gemmataceae bacterium]MCI0738104.1 ATP-binding cassette domain-containing protein [Gemmataceae bacterium]
MNASTTTSLISLRDVSLAFGPHRVLEHISLDIPRGQTLAIIGESGCGKTVLLKLLIGLLQPSAGQVIFDGQNLAELGDRELTRQRLRFGFLFQGAALFDSLSVFDNVAFGLRQQEKLGPKEIEAAVRQRLEEVGLPVGGRSLKAAATSDPDPAGAVAAGFSLRPSEGVEHKKPAELSGGMKKRVGLARALALDPEVILYDEPTTGLDPIMSDVINELILQTRRKHPVTSVVVTHDMKTALKVADRIVMLYPLSRLRPGERQILFDGAPQEVSACLDPRVQQFLRGEAGEWRVERDA